MYQPHKLSEHVVATRIGDFMGTLDAHYYDLDDFWNIDSDFKHLTTRTGDFIRTLDPSFESDQTLGCFWNIDSNVTHGIVDA